MVTDKTQEGKQIHFTKYFVVICYWFISNLKSLQPRIIIPGWRTGVDGWLGGGGGGWVNCHYDKGYVMCYKQQNAFCEFSSSFDRKLYLSPTAVTTRGPAVAGGADADGRGSVGTFQMCSCGNTAVSRCCAGCTRVANLWFWNFDWNRKEDEAFLFLFLMKDNETEH